MPLATTPKRMRLLHFFLRDELRRKLTVVMKLSLRRRARNQSGCDRLMVIGALSLTELSDDALEVW